MSRQQPAAPTLSLGTALGNSEPLARLMQRLRASNDCFSVVRPLLAPGLQEQVRPGPLDDAGWSLLASNGAAAAKLRQLLPLLEEALLQSRGQPTPIRVRVQPPSA